MKIKGYRDQSNHTAIISGDCVIFRGNDGGVGLKMLLPDNPEEKSIAKMTYQPGVPVMGFMLESLAKSVRFVNEVIERLIDLMAPYDPETRRIMTLEMVAWRAGPLKLSPGEPIVGEPVPFPADIAKIVGEAAIIVRKES